MLPTRGAVGDQLLKHREADFSIIQGVAKVAGFEDPGGGNPTQRQTSELFDVISATRTRIREDRHIRLLSDLVFS